jgi:hypothetical protein
VGGCPEENAYLRKIYKYLSPKSWEFFYLGPPQAEIFGGLGPANPLEMHVFDAKNSTISTKSAKKFLASGGRFGKSVHSISDHTNNFLSI